ncbi:hypothetical protein X975_00891, partial [Stegodyphus mimosarum]
MLLNNLMTASVVDDDSSPPDFGDWPQSPFKRGVYKDLCVSLIINLQKACLLVDGIGRCRPSVSGHSALGCPHHCRCIVPCWRW